MDSCSLWKHCPKGKCQQVACLLFEKLGPKFLNLISFEKKKERKRPWKIIYWALVSHSMKINTIYYIDIYGYIHNVVWFVYKYGID